MMSQKRDHKEFVLSLFKEIAIRISLVLIAPIVVGVLCWILNVSQWVLGVYMIFFAVVISFDTRYWAKEYGCSSTDMILNTGNEAYKLIWIPSLIIGILLTLIQYVVEHS